MTCLIAFIKKEWREALASYRVLIMLTLFSTLALLSVFTAKFMPDILSKVVSPELAATLPTPILLDVWLQFFKNVGQMGLVGMVILFSGSLAREYQQGTLVILVTKGLPRWTVITAKFLVNGFLFSLSYGVSILISYGYALIYFEPESLPHLTVSLLSMWLFGLFLLLLLIVGGILFKENYGVLLFTAIWFVLGLILNISPKIGKYNPLLLGMGGSHLLKGELKVSELYDPLIVLGILSGLLMVFSFAKFKGKRL